MPYYRHTGPALSAFNAWVLLKGLETLAIRLDRQVASALTLAQLAESHPAARAVRYPFLPSHPHYEVARRQMRNGGSLIALRSEEHTSELLSLMRISYAVFCLKKKRATVKNNLKT